jgi:hypothetical protein
MTELAKKQSTIVTLGTWDEIVNDSSIEIKAL